jgi:hypothetical protein
MDAWLVAGIAITTFVVGFLAGAIVALTVVMRSI